MKKINEIKKIIKEKDQKLFDLISSISDDEIFNNYIPILKYLNQNKTDNFKMEFYISQDNKLEWEYVASTKKAKQFEEISKLKENFLIEYTNGLDHLLVMKDVRNSTERMPLLKKLKHMSINIDDCNKGLWIYGKNNVGKTHITKSFINHMAKKGNRVSYIFLPEAISILKSFITKPNSALEMNSYLEKAKQSDLLIIDDVSSVVVGPWFRDTFLFPLLEHRSTNNKITIFTSNYKIADFEKKLSLIETPKQDIEAAKRVISKIYSSVEEIILK